MNTKIAQRLVGWGVVSATAACAFLGLASPAFSREQCETERAAVPEGAIEHILVIDLENEDYGTTFGPTSPATYLNSTLLGEGELVTNYFATSHVSLGNYLSQVSGQAPTPSTNNDSVSAIWPWPST